MQQQMSEQEIQEKWTEARICAENRVLSSANELLHSQVSHLKRLINVLVIVAAVLLLLFIGASVYVFDQLKLRDERIEILLTQVHQARAKTVSPAEKEKKQEKNYMAELPLCNFSPYLYMDFCELIDLTYGGKTPGIFDCPI